MLYLRLNLVATEQLNNMLKKSGKYNFLLYFLYIIQRDIKPVNIPRPSFSADTHVKIDRNLEPQSNPAIL